MNMRQARQKALEQQIARIGRQVERLGALSRRFSWYRLGILILGGLMTWLAAVSLAGSWGWWTLLFFVCVLSVVALFHRRLDARIEKFKSFQKIKSIHLARMHLDWEKLPKPLIPASAAGRDLQTDLDITGRHSLHQLLDVAISQEGRQLLAEWLAQSEPDLHHVQAHQPIVSELVPMTVFRDKLLLTFRMASKERLHGESLLKWLEQPYPAAKLRWMLPVSTLWVAVNISLFVLSTLNLLPAYWIISLSLYMAFYFFNIEAFNQFFEAIVYLDTELGKFRSVLRFLESQPVGDKLKLTRLLSPLRAGEQRPSVRLRKVRWVTAGAGMRMNPVTGLLLNLFLPWDFIFAYLAALSRSEVAHALPAWLQVLNTLETLVSLANFAYLNPDYTFPEIGPSAEPVLHAEDLGHPLIPAEEKVCNDVHVGEIGHIAIITGSNMAGKSTFIKTVGINLCLAYAGGPVNATRFHSRPFRLHTCIRIADSITDGFSYFYAEVKCLKTLLEKLDSGGLPVLYLIDEIFRGTNNRERLIGSRAYLRSIIDAQGVGFLATHDLELARLADESPKVQNCHFRDEVRDGKLVFDYRLRPGPCPTTNALKIMRSEGLPVSEGEENFE